MLLMISCKANSVAFKQLNLVVTQAQINTSSNNISTYKINLSCSIAITKIRLTNPKLKFNSVTF